MKIFNKSKSVTMLHNILSLVTIFIFLIAVLSLVSFVLHMVNPEKKTIKTFKELELNVYEEKLDLPEVFNLSDSDEIVRVDGIYNFEIKIDNRFLILVQFLFHLSLLGCMVFIIRNIQDIILSVDRGGPFNFENINRMKNLASLFWTMGGIVSLYIICNFVYIQAILKISDFQIYINLASRIISEVIHFLVIGLIVSVIARVFEKGLTLKQENDLTV